MTSGRLGVAPAAPVGSPVVDRDADLRFVAQLVDRDEREAAGPVADVLGAMPAQAAGERRGEALVGEVADQLAVDLKGDAPDALAVAGGDVNRQRGAVGGVVGGCGDVDLGPAEI